MTTKTTILNHGPNDLVVRGGDVSVVIDAHKHAEFYVVGALTIEEVPPAVEPNLAGGHGDPE
jgi:hypothetical protein